MSEELMEWYNTVPYAEIKNIIRDRMSVMAREYVGIGFYLRRVRDNEMYLEDGYKDVHEFAAAEFGMSRSTVNHCMRINEQFSVGGNSPTIDSRYKDFNKSQLQEMLYLSADKLDEVTPDMTVKEIRSMKNDRLDVEPEVDDQIPGQMSIEDYPECMPEDETDPDAEAESDHEPVSVLGYPLRVYPEGSLIATAGCGNQDCFSCHRDGCEIRQKECYCVEAPLGNPFPCTILNVVDCIRQDIGDKCQFVNKDLAFHRSGDGQPVPCCKECNNPCGYECRRSVEKRHTDVRDKETNKTKPENQEKSSCPPDVHSCIRQEWGTNPEQQHKGAKECAKCWSEWKKRQEALCADDETVIKTDDCVVKPDESAIEADENVIDAEVQKDPEEDDEGTEIYLQEAANLDELTFSQIAIRDYLEEEEQTLEEYEKVNAEDGGLPLNLMMRQRMLVKALRLLMHEALPEEDDEPEEQEEQEEPGTVQPELPVLKNNDQRKEWLRNYKDWGLWYEDEHIGCRYYRYIFDNGAVLVAEEYDSKYSDYVSYLHLFGGSHCQHDKYGQIKYRMHDKYNKYPNSETELVEFLKEVQKKTWVS